MFVDRWMCAARGEGIARPVRAIARRAEVAGQSAPALEGGVAHGIRGVEAIRVAEREDFAVE